MMRRHFWSLCLLSTTLVALTAPATNADVLTFQFDPLPTAVLPGDTFTLTGILTNTTADLIFLHGDMVALNAPTADITLDDLPFFLNAPFSLEPNGTLGDAYSGPFLDITVGADVTPGVYTGFFALSGGATPTLTDPLGSASFSVTVTPEPGSTALMAALGVWGAGFLKSRAAKRKVK